MKIDEIQRMAAKGYNCCVAKCDGNCETCEYDVSEEEEKDFYYTIWKMCVEAKRERRIGWL